MYKCDTQRQCNDKSRSSVEYVVIYCLRYIRAENESQTKYTCAALSMELFTLLISQQVSAERADVLCAKYKKQQ